MGEEPVRLSRSLIRLRLPSARNPISPGSCDGRHAAEAPGARSKARRGRVVNPHPPYPRTPPAPARRHAHARRGRRGQVVRLHHLRCVRPRSLACTPADRGASQAAAYARSCTQRCAYADRSRQTAGLCLAARLSEDPNTSVLVLEAGEANLNDAAICTFASPLECLTLNDLGPVRPASYGSHFGQIAYDWVSPLSCLLCAVFFALIV
jgi:hypothetical protein